MRAIEGPVDRAKVQALAAKWAQDPSSVVEVVHDGFNRDELSGGYAFLCDRGLLICDFDGCCLWSIDPGDVVSRLARVEERWRELQHWNRPLRLDDVSLWHRAAIAALVRGVVSVGDLPPVARPGVTDIDRADALLIRLRRHAREHTEAAALRSLAASDWMLAVPAEHEAAHRCPVCGAPAIGMPWQYASVCDDCYPKTTCSHGRKVSGYNTGLCGGFEALHVDDRRPCAQVTGDGLVWVSGQQCHMGEAKFGGVFVGVVPTEQDSPHLAT